MRTITKRVDKNKGMTVGRTKVSGEGLVDIVYPEDTVAVRDYVASKGYSGMVDWDGKNPTIGGVAVTPRYIENGVAYVGQSDADRAIADMEKRAGITGIEGAKKARDTKYAKREDKALSKVADRKAFTYNVAEDPAYQEYSEVYYDLAERAYRRVLNDNNTSVTGASSSVLSEAMAAQREELGKIGGIVPELYENAYSRYSEDAERNRKDLDSISKLADAYYDRLYQENLDATELLQKAGENERREKQRWYDNAISDEELELDKRLKEIEIGKGNIELEAYGDKLSNEVNADRVATESRAMENALSRGFFIESDEAAMPWLKEFKNADGSYNITPATAALAYEYEVYHTRERAKINAKLGR